MPMYYWGVHVNREVETGHAIVNYTNKYSPKRNRLTHSMIFEEFEMVLEKWMDLEDEFKERGEEMLEVEGETGEE